jgi:hypothetical protein
MTTPADTDAFEPINIPLLCNCCPLDCEVVGGFVTASNFVHDLSACCVELNGQENFTDPIVGWGDPYTATLEEIDLIAGSLSTPFNEWATFTFALNIYGSAADCATKTDPVGLTTISATIQCVVIDGVEVMRLLIGAFSEFDEYPPTPLPTRTAPLSAFVGKTISLPDPTNECPPFILRFR